MSFLIDVIDYLEQGKTELLDIFQIVFGSTSTTEIIETCHQMILGDSTSIRDELNSQLPAVLSEALDSL